MEKQYVKNKLNRRSFLKAASAAVTFGSVASVSGAQSTGRLKTESGAKRSLRFALMTDIHICDRKNAPAGFTKALNHCQSLPDAPSMIITGGDNIMDAYATPLEKCQPMFTLLKKIVRDNSGLPVKWCIGNHDVWGYHKEKTKTTGSEPLWGKKKAIDEYQLPNRYYSFDHSGWRFIILDSTYFNSERPWGYLGKCDPEQREWLKQTLDSTPKTMPAAIVSHIPILSVTIFEDARAEDFYNKVPGGSMHYDSAEIRHLLEKYPNVKLCLSGHTHRIDRVEWRNINYICCGAVSGAWWNGDRGYTDEGYMVVDLFEDGTVDNRYMAYNWKV